MFSFQGTAGQPRNILDQSPVRIPRGYVSAIETGKTKLSLPALIRISKAVNVSLDFLVYDEIPYLIEQYDLDAKEILDSCSTSIERQYLLDTMRLLQDELKNNYILKEKRSKK